MLVIAIIAGFLILGLFFSMLSCPPATVTADTDSFLDAHSNHGRIDHAA